MNALPQDVVGFGVEDRPVNRHFTGEFDQLAGQGIINPEGNEEL